MSKKEKIYIAFGLFVIIGLVVFDFVLYKFYLGAKDFADGQADIREVYKEYTKGIQ